MIAFFATQFLFEQFAHIIVIQMDGWHHDVTRSLPFKLDDALAKVGFYYFDSVFFEIRIHLAFLCEHRLRLNEFLYVMVLQNTINNLVELVGILSPVYYTSVLLCLGCKLI